MKYISILGVTGSIGMQAINVIEAHPDQFSLVGVSAGKQIKALRSLLDKHNIKHVSVMLEEDCDTLKADYPNTHFYWGAAGLITIATLLQATMVLNAVVGFAGLIPTIEAIKHGKDIALANKETMVVAGALVNNLVKAHGVTLLPVDSEHSAIFQCLQGERSTAISKLILTASGGSFRTLTRSMLADVTLEQALKHPNWSMGAKITIDSATLFNKGLEVIEAHYLFDIDYDDIEVLIHQESIIHSMVTFKDTSVMAQLGTPDMRLPIQYAFSYPNRIELKGALRLDLAQIGTLHFEKPDFNRFKALALAYKAGRIGGTMPAVLNAANEQAVALFLASKIRFIDIELLVEAAMDAHQVCHDVSIEMLINTDAWARAFVLNKVGGSL